MDIRQNPKIRKFYDLVIERLGDAYNQVGELKLTDPSLEGKNPFDPNLDEVSKIKMITEACKNVEYFQWIVTGCKVNNLDTVPPSSQAIKVLYEAIAQQLDDNTPFDQWDEQLSAQDVEETLKEIALFVGHGIRTNQFQFPLSELAASLVDTCAIVLRKRELIGSLQAAKDGGWPAFADGIKAPHQVL